MPVDRDLSCAPSRMLGARELPVEWSDGACALPDVCPGVTRALL